MMLDIMLEVRESGEIVDQVVLFLLVGEETCITFHVEILKEIVIMIMNARMVFSVVMIIVPQPGIFQALQIVVQLRNHVRIYI